MHISTKFSLILPSILADLHHPSSKHLYANKDSSPQFSEPVCDVGKDCEISMSPMDPEIKQIRHWDKQEETAEYWEKLTMAELENAEKVTSNLNKKKAKYSIIFLGDGMGIPTITAGRIYSGQKLGMINAESHKTGIDNVADQGHTGLSKTYCIDRQTTDSAASATAYLTGVKGMYYTMGLNGAARKGDCEASGEETYVESVLKKAKRAGFATGLVTTTRVHHASPSGAFANSPDRMWYTDADMPEDQKKQGCKDLAYQVVTNSDMVDVHLGGGYNSFVTNETESVFGGKGMRLNGTELGVNLLEKWNEMHPSGEIVTNKNELFSAKNGEKMLGLFANYDLEYNQKQVEEIANNGENKAVYENTPSLKDMTEKAIDSLLETSDEGFYLFVEGGRIDHGHHDGSAFRALEEFDEFQKTIEFVRTHPKLDISETLIVITADHSHMFSMGGYGWRGYDIRSAAPTDVWGDANYGSNDNMPFTNLGYAQGAGYRGDENNFGDNASREDLRKLGEIGMKEYEYHQQSGAPIVSETHGGEDVAIVASGPWSHLYTGIHEQTYVAYVMMKAQCLGVYENDEHCKGEVVEPVTEEPVNANFKLLVSWVLLVLGVVLK